MKPHVSDFSLRFDDWFGNTPHQEGCSPRLSAIVHYIEVDTLLHHGEMLARFLRKDINAITPSMWDDYFQVNATLSPDDRLAWLFAAQQAQTTSRSVPVTVHTRHSNRSCCGGIAGSDTRTTTPVRWPGRVYITRFGLRRPPPPPPPEP